MKLPPTEGPVVVSILGLAWRVGNAMARRAGIRVVPPLVVGLALAAAANAVPADGLPANPLAPAALWEAWPTHRVVPISAACLRPAELAERLTALARRHPGELDLTEVGRSVEGRPIFRLMLGHGPAKVLLWSQMHGDEPSATPALLDLAEYLLSHRDDAAVDRLLAGLTLVMVPMLNPDGAEAYTRRNAQAIDINRDALNLTTPEGRLLERLRREHAPILGFNLHDQNRRRTVGESRVLAVGAVLAVVGDAAKTVTPGRRRAMRAAVAVQAAIAPFVPGRLARYDDDWSLRAFGDNLTAWGTPVLLIESGGVPEGASLAELTRLNFVALGATLDALAADDLAGFDATAYESIPENNSDVWADVAWRGGRIRQPASPEAYRADLAFNVLRNDREREGCAPQRLPRSPRSEIVELGDARVFGAAREVDATGRVIVAPFSVGAAGWKAHRLLDAAGLDRLAHHGVAEVRWAVPERKVGAALAQVGALRGAGRPRVEVTTETAALPPCRLRRPLGTPTGGTFGQRIEALARACALPTAVDENARLAALWASRRPLLRFEGPASFLVVAAPGDDLLGGAVERVVLEGVELEGGSR